MPFLITTTGLGLNASGNLILEDIGRILTHPKTEVDFLEPVGAYTLEVLRDSVSIQNAIDAGYIEVRSKTSGNTVSNVSQNISIFNPVNGSDIFVRAYSGDTIGGYLKDKLVSSNNTIQTNIVPSIISGSSLNMVVNSELKLTSISANTIYSGVTELNTIISDAITGADTYSTGSTLAGDTFTTSRNDGGIFNTIIPLSTKANLSGATFTGSIFAPTVSGNTFVSGGTSLETIITDIASGVDTIDITRVQPGVNTFTGGTANNPTVNITGGTFDNMTVIGDTALSSLSANTIFSGGTSLETIISDAITGADTFTTGLTWNNTNLIIEKNDGGIVNTVLTAFTDVLITNDLTVNNDVYVDQTLTANTVFTGLLELTGATPSSGTLQMGFFNDANPNAFCVRQTGLGGYVCWMDNANFPQFMLGNSASAVAGFVDVENSATLNLNLLHDGKIVSAPFLPGVNNNTWIGETGSTWGQLYVDGLEVNRYPNIISGTISMSGGSSIVNGSGTTFATDLSVGQQVMVWRKDSTTQAEEHQFFTISAITNNALMSFTTPFVGTAFDTFDSGEIYTNAGSLINVTDINDNTIISVSQTGETKFTSTVEASAFKVNGNLVNQVFHAYDGIGLRPMPISGAEIPLDTIDRSDSIYSLVSGSTIKINQTGWYRVDYNITSDMTAGGNSGRARSESRSELQLNTSGGTFTTIGGTVGAMYSREKSNEGSTTVHITKILHLNSGNKIRIFSFQQSGGGTLVTLPNSVGLTITSID